VVHRAHEVTGEPVGCGPGPVVGALEAVQTLLCPQPHRALRLLGDEVHPEPARPLDRGQRGRARVQTQKTVVGAYQDPIVSFTQRPDHGVRVRLLRQLHHAVAGVGVQTSTPRADPQQARAVAKQRPYERAVETALLVQNREPIVAEPCHPTAPNPCPDTALTVRDDG